MPLKKLLLWCCVLALMSAPLTAPAHAQGRGHGQAKGQAAGVGQPPGQAKAKANRCANAEKHLQRAQQFDAQGKHAAAEAQYRVAMKLEPACANAGLGLSHALRRQGRTQDAVHALELVIGHDADNIAAYLFLADVLIDVGRTSDAHRQMQHAEKRGGHVPKTLRDKLNRHRARERQRAPVTRSHDRAPDKVKRTQTRDHQRAPSGRSSNKARDSKSKSRGNSGGARGGGGR